MIIGYQGELGCYSYNSIKKNFKYIIFINKKKVSLIYYDLIMI